MSKCLQNYSNVSFVINAKLWEKNWKTNNVISIFFSEEIKIATWYCRQKKGGGLLKNIFK